MKSTNIIVLVLLVMLFGRAFVEPGFWNAGWVPASVIGVLLVPATFLMAANFGPRTVPWMLAAMYNGTAALVLGWHAVTMNVAEAHPVAFAISEQFYSLAIAALALVNAWRLAKRTAVPEIRLRTKTWYLLLIVGFLLMEGVMWALVRSFDEMGEVVAWIGIPFMFGWPWISWLIAGKLAPRYSKG